jgi:hypothetical protein
MTRTGPWIVFSFWVMLTQLFLLSQIQVGGYLSPYVYPLILLLAPANFNRLALVGLGGLIGIAMDLHEGSGGLHVMASTALSYARPWILNAIVPRAAEEQLPFAPQDLGINKWTTLILLAYSAHHLWLFAWASHGVHIITLVFIRSALNVLVSASLASAISWFIPKSQGS